MKWYLETRDDGLFMVQEVGGGIVAQVFSHGWSGYRTAQARAARIAGVPVMEDALRTILLDRPEQLDWCRGSNHDIGSACGGCSGCTAWVAVSTIIAKLDEVEAG